MKKHPHESKGYWNMEYSKLNLPRLSEKITDIRESIQILQQYGEQDDQVFLSNQEAIRSARYAFIVLIEAATNISAHFCARLLAKAPANYAESFLLLGERGLIEQNLAKRLGKMAGFRNLLVHGYGEIDNYRMLCIMRKDLKDVELYLHAINELMQKANGGK